LDYYKILGVTRGTLGMIGYGISVTGMFLILTIDGKYCYCLLSSSLVGDGLASFIMPA
jgi:hypothetical protein